MARGAEGRVRRALHAEWTKLCTVPSTGWLLLGTMAATVGIGAAIAVAIHLPVCRPGVVCPADTTRLALYGTRAGQVTVAVLAVLAVTGEYATGLVHLTLAATPRWYQAFGAKAAATVIAAAAAGVGAVTAAVAVGAWIFAARGYTASRGYGSPHRPGHPARLAPATVIYFGLVALLAAGIAAAVRRRRRSQRGPGAAVRVPAGGGWSPTPPGSGASTNGRPRTPGLTSRPPLA
jgi:ABC-2 type transport system permease protein